MNLQRLTDKSIVQRGALALLLALALFMRVTLPTGTMPVRTADRALVISLCTGQSMLATRIAIPVESHDRDDHAPPAPMGGNLCPYALADAGAPPVAAPVTPVFAPLPASAPAFVADRPAPAGLPAHLRPPTRAPPSLG